jgi:hypothetical protein
MRGNWLVVGTLPQLGSTAPVPILQPGVAMSLDEYSGEIVGSISLQIPCMNSSGALQSAIGGATRLQPVTPNADGTFVLQDVLLGGNTGHQVAVQGTLPQSVGGAWSGTYTLDDPNAGCVPLTGSFTAVPVAQLTATYSGTGTLSGSSVPVTIAAVLTQGGPSSLNLPNVPVTSENVISGTLTVRGSPCFTSGTMTQLSGALFGNLFQLNFKMNDGSTMFLSGTIGDVDAGTLTLMFANVQGGACDKVSGLMGTVLKKS